MLTKRTFMILFFMCIVIFAGIGSRLVHTGIPVFDKYVGDVLYAVLFYLFLSLLWAKGTPFTKAVISCGAMLAIETFQLTNIPLQLSRSPHLVLKLISIVLGTTFGWLDLVAYVVGILGVYLLEKRWKFPLKRELQT